MDTTPDGASNLDITRLLLQAADGDTVVRDLYLARAAAVLAPVLSEARYRAAQRERIEVDRLLSQARAAVTRQDWARVRELSGQAADLRRGLDADGDALAVAARVYDAPAVAFDAFSPGLARFAAAGTDPGRVRTETLAALRRLEREDPAAEGLHAARARALDAMRTPAPGGIAAAAGSAGGAAGPEQQAIDAAERGDAETLRRLAEAMLGGEPTRPGVGGVPVPRGRLAIPDVLAHPMPAACVEPAAALGLSPLEVRPADPTVHGAVRDFLERYAWSASPAVHEAARDGVTVIRDVLVDVPQADSAVVADVFAETVSLFALHLYVNSAGVRYVPIMADAEWVLLETHPEGDDAPSPLVRELGLDRRRALARAEVEAALLRHGPRVLRERLGLDPIAFRIVCVPADVYMRAGRALGWGTLPQWTHFDGYQVLKTGRLLALVGGNAKFGGLADLCGIGPSDARDNVTLRLAVVRRERLGARPA